MKKGLKTENKYQKRRFLFIVVDSGDGSGKDTQTNLIARYYIKQGYNVRIRSHPSLDNPFGRLTKKALEEGGTKGHMKAAIFYIIDVIRTLVKYYHPSENEVLIISRYLLGVCYLPRSLVLFGYNFFSTFIPTSEFSFFLDVSPEVAWERIRNRGEKKEMFESLARLHKMHEKMSYITRLKGWIIINGNPPPMKVWSEIRKRLPLFNGIN